MKYYVFCEHMEHFGLEEFDVEIEALEYIEKLLSTKGSLKVSLEQIALFKGWKLDIEAVETVKRVKVK